MTKLLALLTFSILAFGQNPNTATYPGAAATDQTLFVASNQARTVLSSSVSSTGTTLSVSTTIGFILPTLINVDSEIIAVCSATSNSFTVCSMGRGWNGTTGASHSAGASIAANINSYYQNQLAAEIKAIEGQLIQLRILTPDAGISEFAPGIIAVGNGTPSNANGTVIASQFTAVDGGVVAKASLYNFTGPIVSNDRCFAFSSTSTSSGSVDLCLSRLAANTLGIGNGVGDFSGKIKLNTVTMTVAAQLTPANFSTYTCDGAHEGELVSINDSNTVTWGANIAGSSTNHVLGYCNGTNFTVAAK